MRSEPGGARRYERHLLASLKRKMAGRLAREALPLALGPRELASLDSLRAYDDAVTAPCTASTGPRTTIGVPPPVRYSLM